jgi:hypothetical protein
MLDFAMGNVPGKGFSLHEVRNLMISTELRPRQDLFAKIRLHFAQTGLERTAINTIYSHVLNPMIASRSYMSIEPIELWLDIRALRRGLIYPVDPDTDPMALLVQDSGMVPVSTRIAIVNPETCQLCHVGEYGEIWVQSEACAKSFYMSKQLFDEERFNGRLLGGDPGVTYVRTGDLGFLHNVTRPIGPGNQPVEMQLLFVLGSIGETFEVNGLNHFPVDIENSVEKCHRNITPSGCAVFQAGGMVVVIVEVFRKAYLASIVPVIVNAVLNEHQIVVDIVAFVGQGDFPRSRLTEKQRGKILASWVTRKLRTIAQFGIRDSEGQRPLSDIPEPRKSQSTMSKDHNSQEYQNRGSIASETQSRADRSSIMPELPLELPPNHYQLDPTGMFDKRGSTQLQAETPVIAMNDRPFDLPEGISEMPADSEHHQGNPYLTDEKFFDPEEPFGGDTPQGSNLDLTNPGGPPRLSLVNPDNYPSRDSAENTPTSYTGTATVTPTSARPLTVIANEGGRRQDDSPYGDAGNPFAQNIPASVPSFDFVTRPTAHDGPRSNFSPLSESTSAGGVPGVTKGRVLLPSQQARYHTQHEDQQDLEPRPRVKSDASYRAEGLPKEATMYNDGQGYGDGLQGGQRPSVDLSSVAGSVRRRYDGSAYDGYDY